VKLFFDGSGGVRSQCIDSDGNGRLDVRYRISGGAVQEGLVDSSGDGNGNLRQVYTNGTIAHLEADTNNDGRPDVVQYLSGTDVVRQCEDSEYDGTVDTCFEGEAVVPVTGVTDLSEPLGSLGCGRFDPFWRNRR
jgi:hypothetical protein